MYNLMIVGDNEDAKLINNIIKQNFKNDFSIFNFNSGELAIKKAKHQEIDIAIIKIELENVNGLIVAENLKKVNPDMHIIMITKYDYTDFMIRAINTEISGYILMPIQVSEFIDNLNRVLNKIDEEREEDINSKKCSEYTKEFVEQNFIYSLLFKTNTDFNSGVKKYKDILNLYDNGCCINLEFLSINNCIGYDMYMCLENKFSSIRNIVKEVMQDITCIVGPQIGGNRIVLYVSYDNMKIEDIRQLIYKILLKLKDEEGIIVKAGIGDIMPIEYIHKTYEQAIKTLRFRHNNNVIIFDDIKDKYEDINYKEYLKKETEMIDYIKSAKYKAFDNFVDLINMLKPLKIGVIKDRILELLVISCYAAKLNGPNENEFISYSKFAEELKNIDEEYVFDWAYSRFMYIIKAVKGLDNKMVSPIIRNAVIYLEKHYNEDISLDDISKHVSVSRTYFSKLFKEEMGCSYVDWVTDFRINKAKELIGTSDKTVKEISFCVGYNDPNYFSRIFKKVVGVSPSEYVNS